MRYKLVDEIKVIGPSHWATYIINGDASGFDYDNTATSKAGDEDKAKADAFISWACGNDDPKRHGEIVDCADYGFKWNHDATEFGVLGCDCQEYTVLVYERE